MPDRKEIQEWFRGQGFIDNPFDETCYCAESDPCMHHREMMGYLDIDEKDFGRIMGEDVQTGCQFIFSESGNGRTSLKLRMQQRLLDMRQPPTRQFILYLDLPMLAADAGELTIEDCARVLIDQAVSLVDTDEIKQLQSGLVSLTGEKALRELVKAAKYCPRKFTGVQVFVDWVNFRRSGSLRADLDRTIWLLEHLSPLEIEGMRFKFFLPSEFKTTFKQVINRTLLKNQEYYLTWDENRLMRILDQRVGAYLITGERSPEEAGIWNLFDDGIEVQTCIQNWCRSYASPRQLWQLLAMVFQQFFMTGAHLHAGNEHIGFGTFQTAYQLQLAEVKKHEDTINALLRQISDPTGVDHILSSAPPDRAPVIPLPAPPEQPAAPAKILYEQIRQLIARNKIKEAIAAFAKLDPDASALLKRDFTSAKTEHFKGGMTDEAYSVYLSKISARLLDGCEIYLDNLGE